MKSNHASFAVEWHNGTFWLCVDSESGVDMLACFSDEGAANRFKAALRHVIMAAHAAGALGI